MSQKNFTRYPIDTDARPFNVLFNNAYELEGFGRRSSCPAKFVNDELHCAFDGTGAVTMYQRAFAFTGDFELEFEYFDFTQSVAGRPFVPVIYAGGYSYYLRIFRDGWWFTRADNPGGVSSNGSFSSDFIYGKVRAVKSGNTLTVYLQAGSDSEVATIVDTSVSGNSHYSCDFRWWGDPLQHQMTVKLRNFKLTSGGTITKPWFTPKPFYETFDGTEIASNWWTQATNDGTSYVENGEYHSFVPGGSNNTTYTNSVYEFEGDFDIRATVDVSGQTTNQQWLFGFSVTNVETAAQWIACRAGAQGGSGKVISFRYDDDADNDNTINITRVDDVVELRLVRSGYWVSAYTFDDGIWKQIGSDVVWTDKRVKLALTHWNNTALSTPVDTSCKMTSFSFWQEPRFKFPGGSLKHFHEYTTETTHEEPFHGALRTVQPVLYDTGILPWTERFEDGMPSTWSVLGSSHGVEAPYVSAGKLNIQATSSDSINDTARVNTNGWIYGDFDIQVDMKSLVSHSTAGSYSMQVGLKGYVYTSANALVGDVHVQRKRTSDNGVDLYHLKVRNSSWSIVYEAGVLVSSWGEDVQLRLTRVGANTFTGYIRRHTDVNWTQIGTYNHTQLDAGGRWGQMRLEGYVNNYNTETEFDNLQINSAGPLAGMTGYVDNPTPLYSTLWDETSEASIVQINSNRLVYDDNPVSAETQWVRSLFELNGQFDIRVNAGFLPGTDIPTTGGANVIFEVRDVGTEVLNGHIYVSHNTNRYYNFVNYDGSIWTTVADQGDIAKDSQLRILRNSSNEIRVFYWDGAQWEWNGDTAGFLIGTSSAAQIVKLGFSPKGSNRRLVGYMDNFEIASADSVTWNGGGVWRKATMNYHDGNGWVDGILKAHDGTSFNYVANV